MPAGPRHSQNIILQQLEQLSHHEITLLFSETVVAADEYLQGAGALKGDGFPMPCAGYLRYLAAYSTATIWPGGSSIYIASPLLFSFIANDRISCHWHSDGTHGSVWLRKNGMTWTAGGQYATVGDFINGDIFVTVVLRLHKTIS